MIKFSQEQYEFFYYQYFFIFLQTNLYDRGIFANYIYFLGNSLFLFWFPTPVLPDKDGE